MGPGCEWKTLGDEQTIQSEKQTPQRVKSRQGQEIQRTCPEGKLINYTELRRNKNAQANTMLDWEFTLNRKFAVDRHVCVRDTF